MIFAPGSTIGNGNLISIGGIPSVPGVSATPIEPPPEESGDGLFRLAANGYYINKNTNLLENTINNLAPNNVLDVFYMIDPIKYRSISSGCFPDAPIYTIDKDYHSQVYPNPTSKSKYAMFEIDIQNGTIKSPFFYNDIDNKYVHIAVNNTTVFALKQDQTLWYQTNLKKGEYFTKNSLKMCSSLTFSKICLGSDTIIALDTDGYIYTNGIGVYNYQNNSFDKLYKVNNYKYIDVAAGNSCAYAIRKDGMLFSVGLNTSGQLGLGHYNSVTKFTAVPSSKKFTKCYASNDFMMCLDENNNALSCGRSNMGGLAVGNYIDNISKDSVHYSYIYENLDDISNSIGRRIIINDITFCNLTNIYDYYNQYKCDKLFLGQWTTIGKTLTNNLIISGCLNNNLPSLNYTLYAHYFTNNTNPTFQTVSTSNSILSSNVDLIENPESDYWKPDAHTKLDYPYILLKYNDQFTQYFSGKNSNTMFEDLRIYCNSYVILSLIKNII